MRMRYTVICGLSGSPTFFHLPHKRHDFKKKLIIKCILIFYKTFLALRRSQRDIIMYVRKSSTRCSRQILTFWRRIFFLILAHPIFKM